MGLLGSGRWEGGREGGREDGGRIMRRRRGKIDVHNKLRYLRLKGAWKGSWKGKGLGKGGGWLEGGRREKKGWKRNGMEG